MQNQPLTLLTQRKHVNCTFESRMFLDRGAHNGLSLLWHMAGSREILTWCVHTQGSGSHHIRGLYHPWERGVLTMYQCSLDCLRWCGKPSVLSIKTYLYGWKPACLVHIHKCDVCHDYIHLCQKMNDRNTQVFLSIGRWCSLEETKGTE